VENVFFGPLGVVVGRVYRGVRMKKERRWVVWGIRRWY